MENKKPADAEGGCRAFSLGCYPRGSRERSERNPLNFLNASKRQGFFYVKHPSEERERSEAILYLHELTPSLR